MRRFKRETPWSGFQNKVEPDSAGSDPNGDGLSILVSGNTSHSAASVRTPWTVSDQMEHDSNRKFLQCEEGEVSQKCNSGKKVTTVDQVPLEKHNGMLVYSPTEESPESLRFGINNVGFETSLSELFPPPVCISTVHINIVGMTCQSCVQSIEGQISKEKGIVSINVSLKYSNALVKYIPTIIGTRQICEAIDDMGFEASLTNENGSLLERKIPTPVEVTVKLEVEGMTCHFCVNKIEGKIGKLQGVNRVKVNLNKQEAIIVYQPRVIQPEELRNQVNNLGFQATIKSRPASLKLGVIKPIDSQDRIRNKTLTSNDKMTSATHNIVTVVLHVEGMHCKSCVVNIERNVKELPGVQSIMAYLDSKKVIVEYDSILTNPASLKLAIEALPPGNFKVYLPTDMEMKNETSLLIPVTPLLHQSNCDTEVHSQTTTSIAVISIGGMTCHSCVQSVENMISQMKGVKLIKVSLAKEKGLIHFDPEQTNPEELRATIDEMGFVASLSGRTTLLVFLLNIWNNIHVG
ncbi:hypothetical protein scyTo_0018374 [Scyliorhinus torazame]|uniref:HMA domain-containing protein n=1 Tax=Scyliorhinus torazame TaxID=75743 RepID=A0A401PUD7_SCYTO|nr:hypothetical protein [Scyliorhinus torazame]